MAFLLCGLKNTPVLAMQKCSKIGISILPPCFSKMCFHNGLSAAFLSNNVELAVAVMCQFARIIAGERKHDLTTKHQILWKEMYAYGLISIGL